MGNTSPHWGGGVDAVEGVFGHGRAPTVCRTASRWGGDVAGLPRVRHLAQDRLQDLQPLQGARARGADRPLPPAGALRQPAADADRAADRKSQARQAALGGTQDPRAAGPAAGPGFPGSRQKHRSRRAPPAWPGQDPGPAATAGGRYAAVARPGTQRTWCADFKGEFKLGNGQYCYPLTVTDHASRYLLMCEALTSVREAPAFTAFEQLFR